MGEGPQMEVVATAGHVDHGKSALLKELTGMEPDRWDEERRRGLTIDLGYVWTDLATSEGGSLTVAFVDVPGHDGFLTNMLSGVGVVGQALFVVAADDGWSAQSQEHLEILDLLGRRGVAAVVTKADLAGPERTDEVVADVTRRLAGTSLEDTPVLAVDSLSGQGIEELRVTLARRLSGGTTQRPSAERSAERPASEQATRLWIDRSFSVTGAGTVVTGLLAAGHLEVGDEVVIAPHGRRARVRGLQSLERTVGSATAGSRVAVNLAGIEQDQVQRGDALLAASAGGAPSRTAGFATTTFDAQLRALPHSAIGRKGAWHLHVGTAATTVDVHPLLGDVEPGTRGHARLELTDPLPIRMGDRFVLREAGRRRTVGGGVVLDPAPLARPRGAEDRLAHALELDQLADATDLQQRLVALVDAHGGRRSRDELAALLGGTVTDQDLAEITELATIADQVVRREQLAPWTVAILAAAEGAPVEHAVERAELVAAAADRGCPRELAPALIDHAVDEGTLASHGGRLVHHRHEAAYLDARERRRGVLLAALEADPLQPPDPAEATAQADMPSFEVRELIDEGVVVSCGPLLFTATAITDAATRLREGPGRDGRSFTAAEARDAWATTRRAAMPLLEHLRATGVTSFDGSHHRMIDR